MALSLSLFHYLSLSLTVSIILLVAAVTGYRHKAAALGASVMALFLVVHINGFVFLS